MKKWLLQKLQQPVRMEQSREKHKIKNLCFIIWTLFPIDLLFEFFQLVYILRNKGSYKAVFYKEAPVFLSSKSKSIGNCKKQINWKTTCCGFPIDLLFVQLIYFLEAQERGKAISAAVRIFKNPHDYWAFRGSFNFRDVQKVNQLESHSRCVGFKPV